MIRTTLSKVAGGVEHDTVYPADASQISTVGTTDVRMLSMPPPPNADARRRRS
jgi:hypothetical protein